jgi:hypothetical protein
MYRFVQRNKGSEPAGKERFLTHSLLFQHKGNIIFKSILSPLVFHCEKKLIFSLDSRRLVRKGDQSPVEVPYLLYNYIQTQKTVNINSAKER